jgi:hypothetical protein
MEDAIILATEVFTYEQKIPEHLINISEDLKPIWWCASIDAEIIGVAASWIDKDEWHWGRFTITQKQRSLGIGKKLAMFSLNEIFDLGAEKILVEARDVTVGILKKLGGEVTGEPEDFYGDSVTPMTIEKCAFILSRDRPDRIIRIAQ